MKAIIKRYLLANWKGVAYDLCIRAENEIVGTKRGTERMHMCVELLRGKLPLWLRWLVTEESLRWLIQQAFDGLESWLSTQ